MKFRTVSFCCVTTLLSLFSLFVMMDAAPGRAQENSTTWDKPQTIQRKAKPKHVYKPRKRTAVRPKTELSPLLTVQYRVLIKRPDGSSGDSSLASVFHNGDQLRLGVTERSYRDVWHGPIERAAGECAESGNVEIRRPGAKFLDHGGALANLERSVSA